jgi:hypothetical protein
VLFNIYFDEVLTKLNKEHEPMLSKRQIPRLLFADDLALGATSSTGMQQAINCINEFCDEWELKINIAKTKIKVFKKQ